jgi:hypothetical protein
MEKLEFSTLYIFRLLVDKLYELVELTIDLVLTLKIDFSELTNAALNRLMGNNEKYQQVLKRPRKSALTEMLIFADKDRNDRLAETKQTYTEFYGAIEQVANSPP